jgi:predicted ATPase
MSGLTSQFLLKHVRFQLSPPELANTYPFNLPAVQALACGLSMTSAVTFLVGDNGSGKSTILEALAVAWGFNAEGGSVNLRFSTRSTHSSLNQHLVISRNGAKPKAGFFLRAESYYNVLSATEDLEFMSTPAPEVMDGHAGRTGGPLHERSHGESFWDLFMDRFKPKGLYLLDEPESALSPQRQLAALCRFHDLAQAGSQFIIATHSPLLLACPGARILLLDERGITETAYDDLSLVRIYRGMLADPQQQLRKMLLAGDADDTILP